MSLSALTLLPGCVSLTPYSEAVAHLPADRLIEIDGQRVHVESEGQGDAILLLHGFAASTYSFRELAPLLADRFRVVGIDLNGFGLTERPEDVAAYAPGGQLRLINRVIDTLDLEPCLVLGHSYGGALALRLAELHPERIRGLVLVSPASTFEKPPWILRTGPGRLLAYGMARGLLSSPGQFQRTLGRAYHQKERVTPELAETYRKRLLIEGLPQAFDGFGAAMSASGGFEIDFGRIRTPTLVVVGRHDAIVNPKSSLLLVDALPLAELVYLEQSGHSAPEEEPESLAAAIFRFVEEQAPLSPNNT